MGIFTIAKLLGIFGNIKGFFLKYWKIILPIILAVIFYFWFTGWISDIKEEAFNNGVSSEKTRVESIIKKADEENRQLEEILSKEIVKYNILLKEKQTVRIQKEDKIVDRIVTIVNDPIYKECKVSAELLTERNKIRELGPE